MVVEFFEVVVDGCRSFLLLVTTVQEITPWFCQQIICLLYFVAKIDSNSR